MKAVRTQIEEAIVRRLETLRARGLRGVAAYNGELDVKEDELRAAIAGRTPCVLVSTRTGRYTSASVARERAKLDLEIDLRICSSYLRSKDERTTGDVGIYRMIELVRDALFAADLGVDGVTVLTPVSEDQWFHQPDLEIWRMAFNVVVNVEAVAEDGVAIGAIHQDYNEHDSTSENPVVEAESDVSS
jgi:hypothetical protein